MVENPLYKITGAFVSLILYVIAIVLFFGFATHHKILPQSFTSKKKELFLEVTIVDKQKADETLKSKEIKKPKIIKTPPKKEKEVVAKKEDLPEIKTTAKDIKSLFSDIDTSKYKRSKKPKKIVKKIVDPFKELTEEMIASRLKMKKSSSVKKADKLLKKFVSSKRVIKVSYKNGHYDRFFGKVQEILDSNWQLTFATMSGNEGRVTIMIDGDGNMSYKIVSLSYSKEFNDKLKNFLEQMKLADFPRYLGSGLAKMTVNFKDE